MEAVIKIFSRRFRARATRRSFFSLLLISVVAALAFSLPGCDDVSTRLGSADSNSGAPGTAQAIDYGQHKLLVGSFNIQIFGRAKLGKNSVTEILVDVARKFDVLAIQELRSTDQSIVPRFVEMVNANGRKYEYLSLIHI